MAVASNRFLRICLEDLAFVSRPTVFLRSPLHVFTRPFEVEETRRHKLNIPSRLCTLDRQASGDARLIRQVATVEIFFALNFCGASSAQDFYQQHESLRTGEGTMPRIHSKAGDDRKPTHR